MSFLQDATMDTVLDSIFGAGSPPTFYIALFTTSPLPDGAGGVEATYAGYVRFGVTNSPTEFPAASAGAKTNANIWSFGVAGSDDPDPIVAVGFYDDPAAAAPTNLIAVVDAEAPITITNGSPVLVPALGLDLTNCSP